MRRTAIAFTGAATPEVAAEVAAVIGPVLGWDDARQSDEVIRALRAVHAAATSPSEEEPCQAM